MITPISSDNSNNRASIVSNILNRGGRSLSQLLSSAIQLGRNTADNQLRQEQAFLTEQRREINLTQRRAEGDRQNFEDDRKFEEEKRRFDVKFDQSEKQFDTLEAGRAETRALAQTNSDRNFVLGEGRLDVAKTNSATSVFNSKTSRQNADTSATNAATNAESVRLRGEEQKARRAERQQKVAKESQEAESNKGLLNNFNSLTGPERRNAFFTDILGSTLSDSEKRIIASDLGVGASKKQLSDLDKLDPESKATAEGQLKSIEDLEKRLALGRQNPTTKQFEPLSEKERRETEKALENTRAGFSQTLTGGRQTATGIFDRARARTTSQ